MTFSTTPLLLVLFGGFLLTIAGITRRRGALGHAEWVAVVIWLALLGVWSVVTARLSLSEVYRSQPMLASLPAFWAPMVPVALTTILLMLLPSLRRAFEAMLSGSPRAFILVHALRIAAIGGVWKGFNGALPPSFTLPVGVPDLFFGISALVLGLMPSVTKLRPSLLIAWNLAGIAVILPAAPVLMQLGLPGTFHVFTDAPDARALFDFPMVLAPTVIVPMFVFINAAQAVVLWRSSRRKTVQDDGD